ncbi:MAG: hypothetical protein K0Q49_1880 [Haloplasmataceae bacterium]|jgi:hypothetical protein|nr:hypothetical protein [Haloplasmataceae bacterium]
MMAVKYQSIKSKYISKIKLHVTHRFAKKNRFYKQNRISNRNNQNYFKIKNASQIIWEAFFNINKLWKNEKKLIHKN